VNLVTELLQLLPHVGNQLQKVVLKV